MKGPVTRARMTCVNCEYCKGERYACQGDSGVENHCAHPEVDQKNNYIGDTCWDTPMWCPYLKGQDQ